MSRGGGVREYGNVVRRTTDVCLEHVKHSCLLKNA